MNETYNITSYNKVIKLNKGQAQRLMNRVCPNVQGMDKDIIFKILTNRCTIEVDRRNEKEIVISSEFGILIYNKDADQTARYVVISSATATNYGHFYYNLEKKLAIDVKKLVTNLETT